MGSVLSRGQPPPSSSTSSTSIASMIDTLREFTDNPEASVKQSTSHDGASASMNVISFDITVPGQTPLSADPSHIDLSSKSTLSIAATHITLDRSIPLPPDSLAEKLEIISSPTKAVTTFSVAREDLLQNRACTSPFMGPVAPLAPTTPASASAPASPLKIRDMASLSNIILHSPATQTIGTPFATDNAPYEYPFPATTSSASSSAYRPSSLPLSSNMRPPSPIYPAPYPTYATSSCTVSDPINRLALSLSMAIPSDLPSPQIHPKMRMAPPPIPPGLVKRRKEMMRLRKGSLSDLSREHEVLRPFNDTDVSKVARPSYMETDLRVSL